jgi:hypothetical protein
VLSPRPKLKHVENIKCLHCGTKDVQRDWWDQEAAQCALREVQLARLSMALWEVASSLRILPLAISCSEALDSTCLMSLG